MKIEQFNLIEPGELYEVISDTNIMMSQKKEQIRRISMCGVRSWASIQLPLSYMGKGELLIVLDKDVVIDEKGEFKEKVTTFCCKILWFKQSTAFWIASSHCDTRSDPTFFDRFRLVNS